jgi:hypothetical protein
MVELDPSPVGGSTQPHRIVSIIAKKQIVELWHIYLMRTDHRERDIELPAEIERRVVNGRWERCEVRRRQLAHQEWGHFVIRRYQATRMLPWAPSIGLSMLIPGTLLAAGTANQGIAEAPLTLVILQSALITLGGLLALGSGWRVATQRLAVTGGITLESLGVSGHALGFPSGTVASESLPTGYRPGRLRGTVEVEIPIGEWNVVGEYSSDPGWNPAS